MEYEGQNRQFKPWLYQSNRGRGQTRCNYNQRRFQDRFRPITHNKDDQSMDKTIEVGQDMILITEVVTYIIWEVIKGMGDKIIITTEGETLEIKITIQMGVRDMKDRIKMEDMVEALVTVDKGQVQGWLQIEIGSDALNVENMAILQETVWLYWHTGKENRPRICSIWMRIRQYYKPHQ